jgi:sugar lactone lactonase YvrE
MDAELVSDAKATLGEGAIWHAREGKLHRVDVEAGRLHVFNPADGSQSALDVGQPIGTVVPRARGGVMLALGHEFAALDLGTGRLTPWGEPDSNPRDRFNDGKCDPAGRFWAGTINLDRTPGAASLYCLEPDGRVRTMLEGVTNSNGITWSPDQTTMYYIDTPTRQVTAFDYDPATARIANPRAVIAIPPELGKPDGMTIDAEGMLWIALWGGGCVGRFDPKSGNALATVSVAARRVSSCALGGPNRDELYITTARSGASESELAAAPRRRRVPRPAGRPWSPGLRVRRIGQHPPARLQERPGTRVGGRPRPLCHSYPLCSTTFLIVDSAPSAEIKFPISWAISPVVARPAVGR